MEDAPMTPEFDFETWLYGISCLAIIGGVSAVLFFVFGIIASLFGIEISFKRGR